MDIQKVRKPKVSHGKRSTTNGEFLHDGQFTEGIWREMGHGGHGLNQWLTTNQKYPKTTLVLYKELASIMLHASTI